MNIFEIAEKFNLSIAKIKRMEKHGVLIVTGSDGHPLAPAMRQNLTNKQPLSVDQIVTLIQHPAVFAELRGRQKDARDQIAALGDFAADKPGGLIAYISDAALGMPEAVNLVMVWIKQVLPSHPVGHAWLAVRLAQDVKNGMGRAELLISANSAFRHCRKEPEFAGWWRIEKIGGQNRTIYFRPSDQKFLDL